VRHGPFQRLLEAMLSVSLATVPNHGYLNE
jgi:hypothetical protein